MTITCRFHVSPLIQASRKGRVLVVEALLEAGANVDKQDNRGNTVRNITLKVDEKVLLCDRPSDFTCYYLFILI